VLAWWLCPEADVWRDTLVANSYSTIIARQLQPAAHYCFTPQNHHLSSPVVCRAQADGPARAELACQQRRDSQQQAHRGFIAVHLRRGPEHRTDHHQGNGESAAAAAAAGRLVCLLMKQEMEVQALEVQDYPCMLRTCGHHP